MRRSGWIYCLFLSGVLNAAQAASIDSCVGAAKTIPVRVARVEADGVLRLDDGRAAVMEGIRLPRGAQDHAPTIYAAQALAAVTALTALARAHGVTLAIRVPEEDRYGRLRAQVFLPPESGEHWLQIALLRRGMARVAPMPARTECSSAFYAAEQEARAAARGIWHDPAYAVRTSATLANAAGTFQIVQGNVLDVGGHTGRLYLNFGTDWKTDFTVTIDAEDKAAFKAAGVDPHSYAGKTVRVRGLVQELNGPEIELASPAAIEVLSAAP